MAPHMRVPKRRSEVIVRACRLVCPAGKSHKAAISPAFSPLVNTNVLLESLDDLNENPATSNEVHPLWQMPHNAGEPCAWSASYVRGLQGGCEVCRAVYGAVAVMDIVALVCWSL